MSNLFKFDESNDDVAVEAKEYDVTKHIYYPSTAKQTKAKIAFLHTAYGRDELQPNFGNSKNDNPNFLPKSIYTLPNKLDGKNIVEGSRKAWAYKLTKDNSYGGKKGDWAFCYRRFDDEMQEISDVLADYNTEFKKVNGRDSIAPFRVGVQLLALVYMFNNEVVLTNKDTNTQELKKEAVDDVVLVSFGVGDLFFSSGKGVGKFISEESNYETEDDDGQALVINKLVDHSYIYSSVDKVAKLKRSDKPMSKADQAKVESARANIDELMEKYKHLQPIPYADFVKAIEEGRYKLDHLPQSSNAKSISGSMTQDEIDRKNQLINSKMMSAVEEDDLPPF
jgi:hypothetical protein